MDDRNERPAASIVQADTEDLYLTDMAVSTLWSWDYKPPSETTEADEEGTA